MKQLILHSAILFFSMGTSLAQVTDPSDNELTMKVSMDTVAKLTSFSAVSAEGKNHLTWRTDGMRADGVYFIYRSKDGSRYEMIGSKQGRGLQTEGALEYQFTDNFPGSEVNFYQIMHIAENNTYLMSNPVGLTTEEQKYLSKVKKPVY